MTKSDRALDRRRGSSSSSIEIWVIPKPIGPGVLWLPSSTLLLLLPLPLLPHNLVVVFLIHSLELMEHDTPRIITFVHLPLLLLLSFPRITTTATTTILLNHPL